ncbi:hypothetical protein M422DRAFT_159427, partial [Sphaerobolus stellatus SS14]
MVNLNQDPVLLPHPDFSSDEYAEARAEFVEGTMTDAGAAELLGRVWVANRKIESLKWKRHREEAAAEEAAAARRRAEEIIRQAEVELTEKEETRREDRKKNPTKYTPVPMLPPPTLAREILAPYAQRMMEKGRYCEMWYFTAEGLNAAKQSGAYVDSEGVVPVIDTSGGMAWISATAKRDPGSFKEDQELTWEEFAAAVPRMLLAM